MMRYLLLYILVSPLFTAGQDYVTYKVEPGEKPDAVLPMTARYSYPEFLQGLVHFRSGTISRASLNYSQLHSQMQFIRNGDTLYLSNVEDINYVSIATDTFYFQKHWLRQFAVSGNIRLAEQRVLDYANNEKMGAYSGKSPGAVERVQSIDNPGSIDKSYVAREVLIFAERNFYYFADRFGHFVLANKKNLVDLFGKANPALQKYLTETKPDFNKRKDMLQLLNFLDGQ